MPALQCKRTWSCPALAGGCSCNRFCLFYHCGCWWCWKVDEGLPRVPRIPTDSTGISAQSFGCSSGIVQLSCWWTALLAQMPFPPIGLWFAGFLSIWESDFVKTPQEPIYSEEESFPIAICFLCKCMWWPWSHLNPCAHLTCSLVLFFGESEVKSKASLRITGKEFHMC